MVGICLPTMLPGWVWCIYRPPYHASQCTPLGIPPSSQCHRVRTGGSAGVSAQRWWGPGL